VTDWPSPLSDTQVSSAVSLTRGNKALHN
jgi:hypothetical protein